MHELFSCPKCRTHSLNIASSKVSEWIEYRERHPIGVGRKLKVEGGADLPEIKDASESMFKNKIFGKFSMNLNCCAIAIENYI